MTIKHALMATTAALVLTASGFAQAQQGTSGPATSPPSSSGSTLNNMNTSSGGTSATSTLHEIKDNKAKISTMNNISVKQLEDMAVYGSDGKKIGEIERVLGDSSNKPMAVAVDAGGFLGMGTHEVVFPLDKLQKGQKAKQLQTSMTMDEIKALDQWTAAGDGKKKQTTTRKNAPTGAPPATR